jgi:hypothetical protein
LLHPTHHLVETAWGLVGFVVERLATAERIRAPPTVPATGEDDALLRFLR